MAKVKQSVAAVKGGEASEAKAPLIAKINFAFEKETPGTYRFQELNDQGQLYKGTGERPKIGTIYMVKTLFKAVPKMITVTIR